MKHIIIALITGLFVQQAAFGYSHVTAEFNRRASLSGTAVQKQVYKLMERTALQALEKVTGETREDILRDESNFRSYPLDQINKSQGLIRYQTQANNACLGEVTVEADIDNGEVTANATIRCLSTEGLKSTGQSTLHSAL